MYICMHSTHNLICLQTPFVRVIRLFVSRPSIFHDSSLKCGTTGTTSFKGTEEQTEEVTLCSPSVEQLELECHNKSYVAEILIYIYI